MFQYVIKKNKLINEFKTVTYVNGKKRRETIACAHRDCMYNQSLIKYKNSGNLVFFLDLR